MNLLLGNIFSFLSAVLIAISVIKKSKSDLIYWQTINTFFCLLVSIFLSAYASLIMNTFTLIRNILAYKNRLTSKITFILCIICTIFGLYINNLGIFGFFPIAATVSYTFFMYLSKDDQQMRYAVIINLMLWCVHDFYIQAYPSGITDILLCLWSAVNIYKHNHKQKKDSA